MRRVLDVRTEPSTAIDLRGLLDCGDDDEDDEGTRHRGATRAVPGPR
jgi:hypothetical protein